MATNVRMIVFMFWKKAYFKKGNGLQIHIFKEQKKLRGGYYTTAINFLDM